MFYILFIMAVLFYCKVVSIYVGKMQRKPFKEFANIPLNNLFWDLSQY